MNCVGLTIFFIEVQLKMYPFSLFLNDLVSEVIIYQFYYIIFLLKKLPNLR